MKNLTQRLAAFLALCTLHAPAAESDLLASWSFDEASGHPHIFPDEAGGRMDAVTGSFKLLPGVKGRALRFDGYTTMITRRAEDAPRVNEGFTIESWVSLGAYPWNDCPILTQVQPGRKLGYRLMVGPRGQFTLEVGADNQWHSLVSEDWQVPLKEWVHVAGSYDSKGGLKIHVNGELVAESGATGLVDYANGTELRIGSPHQPTKPAHIHREWGTLPTWWTLDGQLDELKLHKRALSTAEVAASIATADATAVPVMSDRQLPSGPDGPGRFGATYTTLDFYEQWDDLWRVDDDADVIVRFDRSPVRMVFWRGSRYSPAWVSENKLWMADQSVEAWGNGKDDLEGCFEHMQDRHCRYSHVRIIESSAARAVVHWRYAPVSAYDHIWKIDPVTGKGCWVDEYYTIYPDGMAVRKPTWKTGTLGRPRQFQESLPFVHPGQSYHDVVHNPYCHVANLKGEIDTCDFVENEEARKAKQWPDDLILQRYHFKSKHKPFIIFQAGNRMRCRQEGPYRAGQPRGCNHWPVGQAACDGRTVQALDRPSHVMGFPISSPPVHETGDRSWWAGLYGMGTQSVEELIQIARAFNSPPEANLTGDAFTSDGFDPGQRAWVVTNKGKPGRPLVLHLAADADHPLHNPAVVVKNAGPGEVEVKLDGHPVEPGDAYRAGWRHHPDSSDLILWINHQTTKPLEISISPTGR